MINAQHYDIPFSSLGFEAQEEIINSLVEVLKESAEAEGKEFLSRTWHDPAPTTWQEAYCRMYEVSSIMWQDYVDNFADSQLSDEVERPDDETWAEWVSEHLRQVAQTKAEQSFRHLEAEVTL